MTKKETDQLLTLLLPLALLVMLESLLATISTSFADITKHVELSSPERQLKKQKKKKQRGGENQTGLRGTEYLTLYAKFIILTATQQDLCI